MLNFLTEAAASAAEQQTLSLVSIDTGTIVFTLINTLIIFLIFRIFLFKPVGKILEKRKELYSKSRRTSGEEKEAVKAELSDISGRLKIIRKEVRLCEGIAARSDTLKEKLQTIRADEHEQQRKELMKNEHRRRSGRTNRPNELGGL